MKQTRKESGLILISSLWNNRRGELLMQPIIIMLFITILVLNSMNLYYMVLKYQYVHHIAKEIAQTIELNGQVTSEVDQQLRELNGNLQTKAALEIQNISYFNNQTKTIQFRDPFTVKVSDVYEMEIFNPSFSKPLVLKIPIESTISGMSEVYWKD